MVEESFLSQLVKRLKRKGVSFDRGLSDQEIQRIEQANEFSFPPDLKSFLQYALPRTQKSTYATFFFSDWRTDPVALMKRSQAYLLEGITLEVAEAGYWLDRWGTRPSELSTALSIVEADFAKAPKLIPVFGHRFIPSQPSAQGNPIYSIVGTDAIVYGANLWDYLAHEFDLRLKLPPSSPPPRIELWDDIVDENSGGFTPIPGFEP